MRAQKQQMSGTDGRHSIVGILQSEIDATEDPRQALGKVKEAIAGFRRQGRTPPEELLTLERSLALECIEASQGR